MYRGQQRAVDAALVPMPELLSRIQRELRQLASATDRLQAAISPAISVADLNSSGLLPAMQSLDRMSQTLCGIADFVAVIASSVPESWGVDSRAASLALSLTDLSTRLTLANTDGDAAKPAPGDCEHF